MSTVEDEDNPIKEGLFDFSDGGRYHGQWRQEGAHGHGVCTLPSEGGVFEGRWTDGSQQSGIFTWSSGQKYTGTWKDGMRHGLGQEVRPDGTVYIGDFTENVRGVYGILKLANGALYQGTWANGLQDGTGVEIYADKGVYKGQYKKGQRNGFGTRSSSTYETYSKSFKTTTDLESTLSSHELFNSTSSDPRTCPSPTTSLKGSPRPSSASRSTALKSSTSLSEIMRKQNNITNTDSNTQIYEGQWEGDKRQGYGILKVPGRYDYFGEWKNNTRTGHGVVVYASGQREEGLWEDGRLTVPLKRKKLSIKYHQLETKVKQAHTAAVQAADMARTKAILAESRASSALGRSKAAMKCVEKSNEDAEKAVELSRTLNKSEEGSKSSKVSPLSGLDNIPPSTATSNPPPPSSPSLLSVPSISPTPSYEELDPKLFEQTTPSSSSNESLIENEEEYRRTHSSDAMSIKSEPGGIYIKVTDDHVPRRRLKTRDSSGSVDSGITKKKMSKQSRIEEEYLLGGNKNDGPLFPRRRSYDPNATRINKSTGELITNSADNTDDEEHSTHTCNHQPTKPVTSPLQQSLNVDVLTQMANWNKTIAYINFILLVFLLLLIVIVVAFMTTTLSQNNPASFMTHMA